ncbi:replication protein RepA [Thalassotalea eurytherma]|uniref:Replication protein RepA n=1 Tax=Thalassotalea eurytherma TaxID=1144278 RepID=A0ABQ6H3Q9_9GAMM|nr:replication protein RepA [Thalassotalea eurytherma]GLX82144.1 replication protein RepA [Thalassotalea eurytherma]
MSLTDLKKSAVKRKDAKKAVNVDDFIEDALNYAKGKPQVVSASSSASIAVKKVKKNYRHATFTLNEQAINQLQYLADETKLAKSHIIRILLDSDEDKTLKAKLIQLLKKD